MCKEYALDVEIIKSHRYDNGADCFATADKKLLKGAPFTTLESVLYLLELGVPPDDELLKKAAQLIFSTWRKDGRFKIAPSGGIYPCHTALAANVLCRLGFASDERIFKTFLYFIETQQKDGGWICKKYSFGHGEETQYSTPYTTLVVLDAFRFSQFYGERFLDKAVDFLLQHWRIQKPISPCHYGIGSRFRQVEYPFRGYNVFYYLYVLSYYKSARTDERFIEALNCLKEQSINGQIIVRRVVPKLSKLAFCKKGEISLLATKRYQEILKNVQAAPENKTEAKKG